ncbi:molybdenum cofactor synthesis 1 isoform 2 [Salpingoeca rosetta]|uniref:GTP 3',8-cyclase n=1 Tax=Salpingoeca rosetta (strain ATCC 50818 / BSB-021) TaxID=946362 RepID=F2U0U4_SALR5|nr:molybdenum cofactor synthesis 1 isoform 2 [Salpingoeca rosetta]EGD80518.1 molybdenum cofactor synthesis 1 isoform 2 [Salpingoeca rosetta]|eukprot:XP_004997079.1 molybdenum cofactor synthesis 1 isoform 2 [Salpingoeca rosetta]
MHRWAGAAAALMARQQPVNLAATLSATAVRQCARFQHGSAMPEPDQHQEATDGQRHSQKEGPAHQTQQEQSRVSSVLTDLFGRQHSYLRISLTERCNLRCQYCMPEEGVQLSPKDELLTFDELVRLARIFASNGVSKIRLTGGEPLLYPQLSDLIREFRGMPGIESVGITTNGLTLARKLDALKDAGLTHLNVSLDTFHEHKFNIISRRRGLDRVFRGIDAAIDAGLTPKINVVLTRNVNDDELLDFVEWTREKPVDVRFIEYMPFDGNRWNMDRFVSYKEMLERIEQRFTLTRLSDHPNDTSKAWWVPGHAGRIGFITSMSEHFCGSCNRLRITANGQLKVCLFGSTEVDLKHALRRSENDEETIREIDAAVKRKKKQHAGMFELAKRKNRPMILIGG